MSPFDRATNRVPGQSRTGAATVHAIIPCSQCTIDEPPYVAQPTTMSCWAAAAAMMVGAHTKTSVSIDDVVQQGAWKDSAIPPPDNTPTLVELKSYMTHSIPLTMYSGFLQQLGMTVIPGCSLLPKNLCNLLTTHGPLGVTIDAGGGPNMGHEIVVWGMSFDADQGGCQVIYHDPQAGDAQQMTYAKFDSLHGAEASAAVNFFYF